MGITLFMATGGLVGYLVRTATGSRPLSLIGAFLFLTSVMTIEAYSQAWTEPLFLFFGFLGLHLLASYLDSSRRRVLLGSAVCIGLAFLARYAGAPLSSPLSWPSLFLYPAGSGVSGTGSCSWPPPAPRW